MTNETDIEQEIRDYLDNLEPCVYALSSPRHDGSTHAVFTNYDNAMEAGEKLKSTELQNLIESQKPMPDWSQAVIDDHFWELM